MNYKVLCAATAVAVLGSAAVQAEVKPYVGLELSHTSADYDEINGLDYSNIFADGFKGVNPYVGFQMNENFAIEAGYLQTTGEDKSSTGTFDGSAFTADIETKISGFHIDAVGRKSISESVDLIGSVGLARLKAEIDLTATGSLTGSEAGDETDTAIRLGAGAEYRMTDEVALRGMVRYTKVDFADTTNNLVSVGVGLNYKF